MSNLNQNTSPLRKSDNDMFDNTTQKLNTSSSLENSLRSNTQEQLMSKENNEDKMCNDRYKHAKTNSITSTSCGNEDTKSEDDPFFPWLDGFRTRESSILSELSITSSIVSSTSSCRCNIGQGKSKDTISTNSKDSNGKIPNGVNADTKSKAVIVSVDSTRSPRKVSPPIQRPKTLSLSGISRFWKRSRKNTWATLHNNSPPLTR